VAYKRSRTPDLTVVSNIRSVIATPKTWVAAGEIEWVDAGGRPAGFNARERLALPDGSQPAGLFVKCYFKPSIVPGCADKVSIGLHVNHHRVFAIDENGPGGHLNEVGIGKPYFGRRIGFPHLHTVCDDAIEGYAEPIKQMLIEEFWDYFCTGAGIVCAPQFRLPTMQLGLLP
jgi:hypothetical protein